MSPRHVCHVYGFAILIMLGPSIPLVVAEAVFNTDNNPNRIDD